MDAYLVELERRLYRSVVDVGVWDVLLGLSLLALGGGIATGYPLVGATVLPIAVAGGPALVQLAARRAGFVQFRPPRTRRIRLAVFFLAGMTVTLLGLLLMAGRALPDMTKAATLLAVPVAIGGWAFELRRFWAYAAIVVLAAIAATLTALPGHLALVAAGAAIFVWGSVVLIRSLSSPPASATQP